ncbi:HEPN domain-containing protein [Flavobacterium sp. DG2-3]|uniref:HEPN domain-containing protein n=1 Tax=Flavobacterium sp. DG2-3 TaxID=3068317 RepID=UPI00273D7355|nr:HEPN domain-containing protein [Flavobacterium sp. DG2-3]MDP5202486.1 HEPN domain-containing protein [Flavobacterium sp. DG2-3]
MNTVLQIRVNWDDNDKKDEFLKILISEIPLLNNSNLESLILRNADDKQFKHVKNIKFKIINHDNRLASLYRKKIDNLNGDIFLLINYDYPIKIDIFSLEFTIESLLKRLALILNLTYNFAIDFLQSVTFSEDDKFYCYSDIILSDLQLAYEHCEKIKWPKLERVDLDQTINSFAFNNYSLEAISKNDYQRSINAFTHVFSDLFEKSSDILFWNMVGIEALLAKGNKDIQAQIKEKSILILGEPSEFKKKLGTLYSYRSKFVHGELNFPAKFSEDYDSFDDEYSDYKAFSTSIHLALLRELIRNKKTEFKFEYVYLE